MGEALVLGVGIGLGVGLPVVLTIVVISYVTVKHHYRMRDEDLRDAEIDVNVEDSHYITPYKSAGNTASSVEDSYEKVYEPSKEYVQFHSGPVTGPAGLGLLNCDTPIPRGACTFYTGSIVESHKIYNTRLGPPADLSDPHLVYTPTFELGNVNQADLSRSLNSLYASPAYASTEKLRAPSLYDNLSERSGSVSSFSVGSSANPMCGPFATPPRARARVDSFHFDESPSINLAPVQPEKI